MTTQTSSEDSHFPNHISIKDFKNHMRLDALSVRREADKRIAERCTEALMDEVARMKQQASVGLAVVTGHNLKDLHKGSMRW